MLGEPFSKHRTWYIWERPSHCWYNENSLHNINVSWQARGVDWNAHVWTMTTLLYQSVGVVVVVEWACVLCGHHIQNDWESEQWICIKFCVKFEHSCAETIRVIQKATALGNRRLAASARQCARSCIMSCAEFFAKHARLQPRFGVLWLLAFPQIKITFEREESSDHWWDSGKYDGAADGNWENRVRSHSAYF